MGKLVFLMGKETGMKDTLKWWINHWYSDGWTQLEIGKETDSKWMVALLGDASG